MGLLTLMLLSQVLPGCTGLPPVDLATPSPGATSTLRLTYTPSPTASPSPTRTSTPSLTSTATLTPTFTATPELLPVFTTKALRPGVLPMPYLANACFYLARRWAADASRPGTVVVPVMFHSIVKNGREVTDPKDISEDEFQAFVQYASYLGFTTITTTHLLDFLENNASIPTRSMILIVDDRRPGVVRDNFLPVLQMKDWSLTLAYIADPNSMQWAMEEVRRLAIASGRLDVQSHGYSGQLYILDQTSEAEIRHEIWESTPVLEKNFGLRPLAFIWPGGNFSSLAVSVARQGGYRLGFTAYSRGPVMFNWIPQGDLEQAVGDPLMLLPRAWSNSVNVNLDEAVRVSEQAENDAHIRYPLEADYYHTFCGGELPALEAFLGTAIP